MSQTSTGKFSAKRAGIVLAGNLSLYLGLAPWISLSANGQATLLETNPAPEPPTFEIPSQVSPLPPAPADEPESYMEAQTPAPYAEPDVAPPPASPQPYVEAAPPVVESPIVEAAPSIAAPELPPASYQSAGCAALLDPAIAPGGGCGPALQPVEPTQSEPAIAPSLVPAPVANSEPVVPQPFAQTGPSGSGSYPPARQVRPTVVSTMPPARQLRRIVAVAKPEIPAAPVVPNYRAVESTPSVSAPAVSSPVPNPIEDFTVVKPGRFALKPIERNPLPWIIGDRSMLFPLPLPVAVSSAFGWRQHPIFKHWHLHSGIDFRAEQGTPVLAAYTGEVKLASYMSGYGLSVLLSHKQGEQQTRYAHLSEIYVKPGQKVTQGDVIGAVGSTGNSTGPHLHFETLVKTPNGMIVTDPTAAVKESLIAAIERQEAKSKLETAKVQPSLGISQSAPSRSANPQVRYQANGSLSQPYFYK